MKFSSTVLAAALLIGQGTLAYAAYPEKPITVVVPFSVGGGADASSRVWAQYLERCLGGSQPVVVKNMPGAGGQIGFAAVAQSPADGYTLAALNFPNVPIGVITNPDAAYKMDSFDYLFSFYGSVTTVSVARDNPLKTVADLVARAKQSGAPLPVGISGVGSDDHMLILKLEKLAGIKFHTIPLGDAAGANTGLLGGHVELATINNVAAIQFAEQLRSLAVASEQRLPKLEDIPTFKEAGYDIVNGTRHVIGTPKGMPAEAREKVVGCFEQIAKDPAFIADIDKFGYVYAPIGPDEASAFAQREYDALNAIWQTEPWK